MRPGARRAPLDGADRRTHRGATARPPPGLVPAGSRAVQRSRPCPPPPPGPAARPGPGPAAADATGPPPNPFRKTPAAAQPERAPTALSCCGTNTDDAHDTDDPAGRAGTDHRNDWSSMAGTGR
ncbi:hypothetical protein GCM10010505_55880 [Kitasatospora aburaviensis]